MSITSDVTREEDTADIVQRGRQFTIETARTTIILWERMRSTYLLLYRQLKENLDLVILASPVRIPLWDMGAGPSDETL
jgi:hypothetical protein